MMTQSIQTLWSTYADAWRDISDEQRESLLSACVTDDVTFTSPDTNGATRPALKQALKEFQAAYPGAYFDTTSLVAHNNQLLAGWTLRDNYGSELLTGNSYARLNEEGQICHLAGFWA